MIVTLHVDIAAFGCATAAMGKERRTAASPRRTPCLRIRWGDMRTHLPVRISAG
jgi:hypothetical protein